MLCSLAETSTLDDDEGFIIDDDEDGEAAHGHTGCTHEHPGCTHTQTGCTHTHICLSDSYCAHGRISLLYFGLPPRTQPPVMVVVVADDDDETGFDSMNEVLLQYQNDIASSTQVLYTWYCIVGTPTQVYSPTNQPAN